MTILAAIASRLARFALVLPIAWVVHPVAAQVSSAQTGIAQLRPPLSQHVTLVVRDIDRSVDFYRRIGLVKSLDLTTQDTDPGGVIGAAELPLPVKPKVGRMVFMSDRNGEIGKIGLLGYDKPRLRRMQGKSAGIVAGDIVVDIDVPDIQAVYSQLSQIGAHFRRPLYEFQFSGPDGVSHTIRRMFVFDPDGHILEITQQGTADH